MNLGPGQDLEIVRANAATTNEMKWTVAAANERTDTTGRIVPQPAAQGSTNGTTPVTILNGPTSGKERSVRVIVTNYDTVADAATLQTNTSGTRKAITTITLPPGYTMEFA